MNGLLAFTHTGSMAGMADPTRGARGRAIHEIYAPQSVAIARKSPKVRSSAASYDLAVGLPPGAHRRGRVSGTPGMNASLHFAMSACSKERSLFRDWGLPDELFDCAGLYTSCHHGSRLH